MGRPRAARSLRPVAPRLAKDAALIWTTKLLFSLATLCFGIGYGARWRANPLHRQLMAGGIAIGWTGAGLYALGRLAFGLSGRPAYWLVEAAGSASTARDRSGATVESEIVESSIAAERLAGGERRIRTIQPGKIDEFRIDAGIDAERTAQCPRKDVGPRFRKAL